MLAFLDVCINNKDPSCLLTSSHPINTFTRLLNNLFSSSSFPYKIGLIRTLVGRAYKINNSLLNFNEDANKLYFIFKKYQYPKYLISRVVKSDFDNADNSKTSTPPTDISIVYFKLPYLKLSNFIQGMTQMVVNKYCTNPKLQLQFSSFKIKNLLSVKDHVPRSLRSYVVYRFNCIGCNYVQIGETTQHLSTRVREYILTDKNYNIFKHL